MVMGQTVSCVLDVGALVWCWAKIPALSRAAYPTERGSRKILKMVALSDQA